MQLESFESLSLWIRIVSFADYRMTWEMALWGTILVELNAWEDHADCEQDYSLGRRSWVT